MKNITKKLKILTMAMSITACGTSGKTKMMLSSKDEKSEVSEKEIDLSKCISPEEYFLKSDEEKKKYLKFLSNKSSRIENPFLRKIENYNHYKGMILKKSGDILNNITREFNISIPTSVSNIVRKYLKFKKNNVHIDYIFKENTKYDLLGRVFRSLADEFKPYYWTQVEEMFANKEISEIDYFSPFLKRYSKTIIEIYTASNIYPYVKEVFIELIKKQIFKTSINFLYEHSKINNLKDLEYYLKLNFDRDINDSYDKDIDNWRLRNTVCIFQTYINNLNKNTINSKKIKFKNFYCYNFSKSDYYNIFHLLAMFGDIKLFSEAYSLFPKKIMDVTPDKKLTIIDIAALHGKVDFLKYLYHKEGLFKKLKKLSFNLLCKYLQSSVYFQEIKDIEFFICKLGCDINYIYEKEPLYIHHLNRRLHDETDIKLWLEYIRFYIELHNADIEKIINTIDFYELIPSDIEDKKIEYWNKKIKVADLMGETLKYYASKKRQQDIYNKIKAIKN